MTRFDLFGLSDVGRVRTNNEDSFLIDEELGLLIVADGMGGHAAGEVASRMAVDVVRDQVRRGLKDGRVPQVGSLTVHLSMRARLLAASAAAANQIVHAAAQEKKSRGGMGTTLTAVLLDKKSFAVAHVGDSRLYLLREGALRQVSRDHSLVAEQVAQGFLSAQEAEKSPVRNVLTRAVGVGPEVEVDADEWPLKPGDRLLLCSDGLTKMMTDGEIASVLSGAGNAREAAERLVSSANEKGGEDNVTAAVAEAAAGGGWPALREMWRRAAGRKP